MYISIVSYPSYRGYKGLLHISYNITSYRQRKKECCKYLLFNLTMRLLDYSITRLKKLSIKSDQIRRGIKSGQIK